MNVTRGAVPEDAKNLLNKAMALVDNKLLDKGEDTLLSEANRDTVSGKFSRVYVSRGAQGPVQFAVVWNKRYTMVLFPYSRFNIHDWVSDAGNITLVKQKFCGDVVHAGFYRKVAAFWPELKHQLDKEPHNPVVFAGHSRGGALAVLSALHLEKDDKSAHRILCVVTAGQPRVVGRKLARQIDKGWGSRYYRCETSTDIVSSMPRFSFVHCGTRIFFDKEGLMSVNPSTEQVEEARTRDLAYNDVFMANGHHHSKYLQCAIDFRADGGSIKTSVLKAVFNTFLKVSQIGLWAYAVHKCWLS